MADNQQEAPPRRASKKAAPTDSQTFKIPKVSIEANREAVRQAAIEEAKRPVTWLDLAIRFLPVWALLLVILLIAPALPFRIAAGFVEGLSNLIPQRTPLIGSSDPIFIITGGDTPPELQELPPPDWPLEISTFFTPEVQFWEEAIASWSVTYRVPPNLIATIMQIESCGNPTIVSPAGATGLFQVMPFHFEAGEDATDPNTNAKRGITFFGQLMADTNGDVGLAFAGYNGGPSLIGVSPANWPTETQNYQFWGSGIYEEASMGMETSPTLQQWLNAGGATLCSLAAEELSLVEGS